MTTPHAILVLRNRRTGGYSVTYVCIDKRGGSLHRTIDCRTIEEAGAEAIEVNRRVFDSKQRIIGLPFGFPTR